MNRYVIMSRERSSYEKFSEMIRKNDPKSRVMRVRDTTEAYTVARSCQQPVCMIDIERLSAPGDITREFLPQEDMRIAKERLGELKRYIELNLSEKLSLEELSKRMYITPNYLSALFKKCEKINLMDYVEDVRMRKAKFILETQRRKSPCEVGKEVGYQNSAYFSRVFKKHFGVTPFRYRKRCLQHQSSAGRFRLAQ